MKIPSNLLAPRSKTSPLIWLFLVSIVANLFFVGVLASGVLRGSHHGHFGPMALATHHGEDMVDWMVRYLDKDDAKAFREAVQSHSDELKQAYDQVHQAIAGVSTAYQQDPPDPAALQAAIDHLSEAKSLLNEVVGKILQDSYAKLSPAGRHRLAKLSK
jgi:uncharacterized membrane protein